MKQRSGWRLTGWALAVIATSLVLMASGCPEQSERQYPGQSPPEQSERQYPGQPPRGQ